ncbi:hypothetical protein FACS189472_18060 [Alphaproteobacteria bacterium]|nr:hypothetical protein FACS189472_18060 [Alphaproteobacteria bacterium]
MSQQTITPELIKNLEETRINEDFQNIENFIVPKLSENAIPVVGYANTYFFDHGRYFFDNDAFWYRVSNGFKRLKMYGDQYPHAFLYAIGVPKAVSVAVATFKHQFRTNPSN